MIPSLLIHTNEKYFSFRVCHDHKNTGFLRIPFLFKGNSFVIIKFYTTDSNKSTIYMDLLMTFNEIFELLILDKP